MSEIKTINFSGKLYRANTTNAKKDTSAANNYKGAPIKYFTLNKSELSAYTKKGTTYKKNWNAKNLVLVDILDLGTRQELEKKFASEALKKSLRTAFPVNGSKVSRVSNDETTKDDFDMLKELCRLGYDGYYMKTINEFHSEVGLCPKTFGQLKLSKNAEEVKAPENIKRKSRNNHKAQNNNVSTSALFNMSVNIPRGALFNMSGNVSNNIPNLPRDTLFNKSISIPKLSQSPKSLKRKRQNNPNNTNNTRKIKRLRPSN